MSNESHTDSESTTKTQEFDEASLALGEILLFLWKKAWLILGCALLFAVATASFVRFLVVSRYEATTTLIVTPPTFSSSLKPPTLSVQGYQKLLESDALIADVKRRLVEESMMGPEYPLSLGNQLRTRIFVSRRAEEKPLAPIIEIIAAAPSPELASSIANTWAETFLQDNRRLNSSGTLSTIQFIEEQFLKSRESLETVEDERRVVADVYQEKLDEAAIRWDRRLVSFQQETEKLVIEYQAETRTIMEDTSASAWKEIPPGDVGSSERAFVRFAQLQTQLAQTPQFVTLEKAISDDALWQALALRPERVSELQERTLVTRELNPVHSHLSLELSRLEINLDDVPHEHRGSVQHIVAMLDTLQRQRNAGLSTLLDRRAVSLSALKMEKLQEIEAIQRERSSKLARLDREIQSSRQIFNELATEYEQAELARAELSLADIQLGSPAVPPFRPESKGLVLKSLAAAFLGGGLGLLVAVLQGVLRSAEYVTDEGL